MFALSVVTSRVQLSDRCLTTLHTVVCEMATTLDDISDGRVFVNIVAGYKFEYWRTGVWPGYFIKLSLDYASVYFEN